MKNHAALPFLLVVFLAFIGRESRAAGGATVESFTPQGETKDVAQVVARFSEPMVPFGDPSVAAPFEVTCAEPGTGRWLDTKQWVFDFAKTLPAGVGCRFVLKAGLKTLAGKELDGRREFAFSTGGPAIKQSSPWEGSSTVTEDQAFVLDLDAVPDIGSISEHAYFTIDGVAEKVGVKVITGKERRAILTANWQRDAGDDVVVLQAKQAFTPGARLSLVWGKGIRSKTGVATSQDQVLAFETRKAFVAEFTCERENADAGCLPIGSMGIQFSAPVRIEAAEKVTVRGPDNRTYRYQPSKDHDGWTSYVQFKGPFPESTEMTVTLPSGLVDDSGRKLTNADRFPLKVKTDRFPPLAKFAARFGILERKAGSMLPITVRNLEPEVKAKLTKVLKREAAVVSIPDYLATIQGKTFKAATVDRGDILYWLRRVDNAEHDASVFATKPGRAGRKGAPLDGVKTEGFKLPRKESPKAFEVVGIPMGGPGLYIVEVQSASLGASLLGKPAPFYVPTAVLVTDLAVHFKWGRESSLAWVTRLHDATAVEGAAVEIRDCQGKVLWKGTTDFMGAAHVEGLPNSVAQCHEGGNYHATSSGLLVIAEKGDDMAFVHTSWDGGIEKWRFNFPYGSSETAEVAHTVFDRTLLRAGDTLHMKHLVRRHTGAGLQSMPIPKLPQSLLVRHLGSEQKYRLALKWDANGTALTTWSIPKEAKLGMYQVSLVRDAEADSGWNTGTFRVEEFRIPLLKGVLQPPVEKLVRARELRLDAAVTYLAGGGASNLPVKLRSDVEESGSASFDDYEDFQFANGRLKEEVKRRHSDSDEAQPVKSGTARSQAATLDARGTARLTVADLPTKEVPFHVVAELEYRDPSGEVQTVSGRYPIYPSDRLVGLKVDSWVASKDDFKIHAAVVDLDGKGVPGAAVRIEMLEKKTYSHRKRILGGYYAYEHVEEIRRVGEFCDGETNPRGLLVCQGKVPVSGNVVFQAVVKDGKGRPSGAHREVWIAGAEEWWFPVGDSDRMDVLPEAKRYEPGKTARFQVRMPFREATALVTVEREGIIDTYVQKIQGKSPYVEIPVKPSYAPNVYVSVLAVRGRVGETQPTALVDLGRPAYKLGVAEIRVGTRAHELAVKVSADRAVYRVREKAIVNVQLTSADGKAPREPAEVALAAVDEGLLQLMPNSSWNLLDAMLGRRPFEVDTATAQMHVIGRRHFGLKALPHGGGGGHQPTRELFDTLLLWKGSVKTDKNGRAKVTVPLNDSITSFRIVAIAQAGVDKFGSGSTTIRTSQPLMLFAGVPPVARGGDEVQAPLTVRNATDRPIEVEAFAKIKGVAALKPISVKLAGGESKEIEWKVAVPADATELVYELGARTGNGVSDSVRVTQKIVPAVPVRTLQASLQPVEGEVRVSVERPGNAIAGRGGIQVALLPKLAGSAGGVKEFFTNYPYHCLEQEVSRAVGLRDRKLWAALLKRLPTYQDADGLFKYFPSLSEGSDVLTAYVVSIARAAGWGFPDEINERALNGLANFVEGSVRRGSALPTADLSLRKLAALEALTAAESSRATAGLLSSITVEPNLWPTSALIDWRNVLSRLPDAPDRERRLAEADNLLRSRLRYQGTTVNFSTDRSDRLWWLMTSNDTNAVRLVHSLASDPAWKSEMPRLMRGTIGRMQRGRWDLTTANAWGVLAMERFGATFEATPVGGRTNLALAEKPVVRQWNKGAPEVARFDWPSKKEELRVSHAGTGKPWLLFQSLAALPLTEPLSSGYWIERSLKAIERKSSSHWSRSDIVRVSLKMRAQSDMTWVVVTDPIPAGSTILGSGLGGDSALATRGERREGWVWPAFEERSFEGYRAYYEMVPAGTWTVEYTVRLNNAGRFALPPTRVEAMYAPEMFGETPNPSFEVRP